MRVYIWIFLWWSAAGKCSLYKVKVAHCFCLQVCIRTCEVSSSLPMTAPVQPGSHRVNDEGKPWPKTVTTEPDPWRQGKRHWLQNRAGSTDEPNRVDLPNDAIASVSLNASFMQVVKRPVMVLFFFFKLGACILHLAFLPFRSLCPCPKFVEF